jgi:hypothetical protein
MHLDIKQIQRMVKETTTVISYTTELLEREKQASNGDEFKINRYLNAQKERLVFLTSKLDEAFRQLKVSEQDRLQATENIKKNTQHSMKNDIIRMYTHKEVFDCEE